MALNDDITQILEEAKSQIVANMASKGVNASGRTAKAFAVKKTEGGFALVLGQGDRANLDSPAGLLSLGRAPLVTVEQGRGGGRVPKGFYYIIKQWTRDKQMSFASEAERGTFAFFLSRKIAREGTKRHKINVDVYSTPALEARDKIKKSILDAVSVSLHSSIKKKK